MSIDENDFKKAYDLWNSFKQEVLYKNRFVINHNVLDYLIQMAEKNQKLVEEGKILYRARIYDGDDTFLQYLDSDFNSDGLDNIEKLILSRYKHDINTRHESGFWGFDSKSSFVPPGNDYINDGRTNPAFIKYLYTSEDPYTALVEVRPYLSSKVSIAEIRVNESLKIADFSYESFGKFEGFEQNLIYLIMKDFSLPSDSNKKNYIPIQYVAEFIKSLGFEGIKFNSSLHGRGRNLTIFNYEKCSPIGSKLYKIEDVCFEAKGIAPENETDLIHWKLKPYKEKQIEDLLSFFKNKVKNMSEWLSIGSEKTSHNKGIHGSANAPT